LHTYSTSINLKYFKMKNTLFGLSFLIVVMLSSCGVAATPEHKNDLTEPETGMTNQVSTNTGESIGKISTSSASENETVVQMTKAMFLEKIYDFEKNPKQWTFKGDKPCVIDFYADWCRPCKMVAPIMAELSEKYNGQIVIYKVNTDQERELAQFFGIRSIPTVFFCPSKGDPQMTQGALPKEDFEKIITEVLLQKK
jgi:thioredoxin